MQKVSPFIINKLGKPLPKKMNPNTQPLRDRLGTVKEGEKYVND